MPSNFIKSATPGYLRVYQAVKPTMLAEKPISATSIAVSTQEGTGFKLIQSFVKSPPKSLLL